MAFVPDAVQVLASRVFTIVSKLKPKSTLSIVEVVASGSTSAIDCAACVAVLSVLKFALLVLDAASLRLGVSPPTRFVTGCGGKLAFETSVR